MVENIENKTKNVISVSNHPRSIVSDKNSINFLGIYLIVYLPYTRVVLMTKTKMHKKCLTKDKYPHGCRQSHCIDRGYYSFLTEMHVLVLC